MKKLISLLCCGILVSSIGTANVSANEKTVPEGFDSLEQYEQAPDYYDAERVKARNDKMKKINDYTVSNRKNTYTISLPLRAQQNSSWCAPASGEMIIDYQLGENNTWTQSRIASEMKTTSSGTTASNAAAGLRTITGLNFEVQKISELPLMNALKADINGYVGVMLLVNARYLYDGFYGGHAVAAKGYSDADTVIYLDPYSANPSIYGQHEVSISTMTNAIKYAEGLYIW